MEKHEKRCFRNPNRFCDACGNTGKVVEHHWSGSAVERSKIATVACEYCSKFDAKQLAEIEAYEATL